MMIHVERKGYILKRYLLSVLAVILVLFNMGSINSASAQQVFTDVPITHPNYEDIGYLLDKAVISSNQKVYGVKDIVTREEVAVMVAKAKNLDGTPRDTKFKDVPKSNPNSGYIQSAVEAGIIKGYDDGTFRPTVKVTRGHMAAFIARAFELPNGNKTFKDVASNSTAYKAVSQLAAAGITTGYEDNTFKPQNNLTRGHISAFLARALRYEDAKRLDGNSMAVHFIDVGQGDSIFIQSPNNGKTMLIDAGTKEAGKTVVAYLKSLNVSKIDYVVATHPDADHIGGLIEVVKSFKIGEFIDSGKTHTSATYEQLMGTLVNLNILYSEAKIGDLIALDGKIKTQVLSVNANAEDNNDASIVLKLTYNKISYLLTGDAGTNMEKIFGSQYDVKSTILKAGHHGSSTSSSYDFLQKVKPAAVILSYGKDNDYGHPHQEVTADIKKIGAKAYSTAQDGTIVIKTDGNIFAVTAKEFVAPNVTPKPTPVPTPTPTGDVNLGTYVIPGAPTTFKNCAEMKKYYPKGVSSSHPAYAPARDGDKDGWACEG